jgi:hypothetical protein
LEIETKFKKMFKAIKRVILSSIAVLTASLTVWLVLFLNPSISYAHSTTFDYVTVYHNDKLEENTENVIASAVETIKKSAIFDESMHIHLCLNDDLFYPKLNPIVGDPIAYALFNKTVIKNCTTSFEENILTTEWEVNNFEKRKFELTWILAHEFSHNMQYHFDSKYQITSTLGHINWKLEGHAEYIARNYINDGLLKEKIFTLIQELEKEQSGLPVRELENNTLQIQSYVKYALVVQFLLEEKKLSYSELCKSTKTLEESYNEMLRWAQGPK